MYGSEIKYIILLAAFSFIISFPCYAFVDANAATRGNIAFTSQKSETLVNEVAENKYPGQDLEKETKISILQARDIALKAQPGQIIDEELEKEKGGSGLRYSFDIRTGDVIHEVGVDAVTGLVLENSVEIENKD